MSPGNQALPFRLIEWIMHRSVLVAVVLIVVLAFSAFGVIYVVHLNRQLYGELQQLQAEQDALDYEYEKLLLEQSAWSEYSRVEKVSRSELAMSLPPMDEMVMVTDKKN
jgi:cell division protein FtsL